MKQESTGSQWFISELSSPVKLAQVEKRDRARFPARFFVGPGVQLCLNRLSRESRWLRVVLWAGLIWLTSSIVITNDYVQQYVYAIFEVTVPNADMYELYYLLRKSVHPVTYFFLGLLLFRAIRGTREGWQVGWATVALLLSAIFAASDELHQMFVPTRTGSIRDVVLDVMGTVLSQIALWAKYANSVSRSPINF